MKHKLRRKTLAGAGNVKKTRTETGGYKMAIELVLAGIRGWEAGLRQRMDDGEPNTI